MHDELEKLRAENANLRDELERFRSSETRERLLDAAREVASGVGFAAEITEIARRSGISTSTLYRHFVSREALLQALVARAAEEVLEAALEIGKVPEPEAALREWMLFGFSMVERWGVLALAISAGLTPDWARGRAHPEDLYRFTGRLLERWRDAGCAREDMNVRQAVRVWFALVSPLRVRGCLADGMSVAEIADETLGLFRTQYGKPGAPVLDPGVPQPVPRTRPSPRANSAR